TDREKGAWRRGAGLRVWVENDPPVLSEREDLFVGRVADHLPERARAGAFDKLIVAAEPRALGMFRKCAPQPLKTRIVAEIDRDHVHTPVKQLEQALSEHL